MIGKLRTLLLAVLTLPISALAEPSRTSQVYGVWTVAKAFSDNTGAPMCTMITSLCPQGELGCTDGFLALRYYSNHDRLVVHAISPDWHMPQRTLLQIVIGTTPEDYPLTVEAVRRGDVIAFELPMRVAQPFLNRVAASRLGIALGISNPAFTIFFTYVLGTDRAVPAFRQCAREIGGSDADRL